LPQDQSSQFDRLPPHSIEAEMCLIASMMLDKDVVDQVVQIVNRDSFFQADHQILFDIMVELRQQSREIDALIVREELAKRQLLDDIGGIEYLAQIINCVPSAAHGAHYASIVREKALLRQLISASNDILRDAYAPHETADLVLDNAERRIFKIAEQTATRNVQPLDKVITEVFDRLDKQGESGIKTDYYDLDDYLNGLQDGEMIIVAARPSMGKTAFAMNIVETVACRGIPCAVFSLEMSRLQLAQRLLCSRGGVDAHKLRRGMLQAQEYQRLAGVAGELAKAPVWVDDSPRLTILDLRAKARRLVQQHGIKLIMIDYMQLMDNPGPDSRQQQISEISRGIKGVARELNVPVLCLSQLNRASEGREGHRPRMSDLRESGSIEQDADVIMLLHREDYYRMGEVDFQPDNIAEIIIAKQRNGPTGLVKLAFQSNCTRFVNLASGADPYA